MNEYKLGQRIQGRSFAYILIAKSNTDISLVQIGYTGNVEVINGHAKVYTIAYKALDKFLSR